MATRKKTQAAQTEAAAAEETPKKAAAKKPAAKKAAKKKTAAKKVTAKKKPAARRRGADADAEELPTVDADADAEEEVPERRGKGPHYLVVVESPAKAKTIKKYLGSGYTVKASVGHVKDLPKSKIGVDVEDDFKPEYTVIKGKEKVLNELKKMAKTVDRVFLATDPDREGEAIAWHIKEELGHPDSLRVTFNEITKRAVQDAIAQPRQLNQDNYDSQQTRRILDRLVGYQISPLLWKKIRRGLSAGRVQSVAVRLIVEREAEIKAFQPEEYWTLDALVQGPQGPPPFKAKLSRVDGKKVELKDRATTDGLVAELKDASFTVAKVDRKERRRNAPAPFITSKLQQEAANRLHFTAKKTMTLAQKLYEGVPLGEEGQTALITYMRTDSTRLSDDAVTQVREFIGQKYGADYLPPEPMVYKSRKSAQDAHEAIRPTSLEYPPERVRPFFDAMDELDMFRLYELIWNRFVACQMKPAVYDQTAADITAGRTTFRASGSTLKFPGYLGVYGAGLTPEEESERDKAKAAGEEGAEDVVGELPPLNEGEVLSLDKLLNEQHFTQPPPRFSEATLVKELEERGIGRPSTYAAILSNIQDKKYVEKLESRFRPTDLGQMTNELLVKHFPHELDVSFTASMEEKLDQISDGGASWKTVLRDFYGPFKETLEKAEAEMRDVKREEIKTDIACEKCGNPFVIKFGKMGHFLACSNYPDCKNTKDFKRDAEGKIVIVEEETTDEKCEKCGKPMVIKRGRFGRFMACSGYPDCKTSKPISIGVNCPECKVGYLTERRSGRGKIFFGCNRYPECKFAAWDRPLAEACPQCASPYLLQKFSKRDGAYIACPNKECDYRREVVEPAIPGASAEGAPAPTPTVEA
ncbi:type I DNA topoisomerase [Corallococcus exiguus]|uniref:type I DNA topoisomerase n=1 Tax=Corallococcus exiguus TaxID=83462 RepID=UPI001470C685|nr:type I DNA topoisomerase [Corallococcus exiguus]NNB86163.1 type I DNA topoisomerase [Corallococcus exiguus]NNB97898.1 type I DNA topoisomerase [Corallococcus exiguus]NNC06774.1 type I DNA topoisomerase [Corallococcus exiguus]